MNRILSALPLVFLAACSGGSTPFTYSACEVNTLESPAVNSPSMLGFSANEASEAYSSSIPSTISVIWPDQAEEQRSFVVSFKATEATVRVATPSQEAQERDRGAEVCSPFPAEEVMEITGVLTIESTDGWVAGQGEAILFATGLEPENIRLDSYISLDVTSQWEMEAMNTGADASGCEELEVHYSVAPTSSYPDLGSIVWLSCNSEGTMVSLQAEL